MIKPKHGFLFFALLTTLFFCSCSDAAETTQNANSQNGKLPVTGNSNVTPLSTPTPLQSPSNTPLPTPTNTPTPTASAKPTPNPTSNESLNIKVGKSTGVVTKINMEMGSVELDHDDIPGMMPAMLMEFYVKDKKLLNGLKVGDKVSFILEERNGADKIIEIKKQ